MDDFDCDPPRVLRIKERFRRELTMFQQHSIKERNYFQKILIDGQRTEFQRILLRQRRLLGASIGSSIPECRRLNKTPEFRKWGNGRPRRDTSGRRSRDISQLATPRLVVRRPSTEPQHDQIGDRVTTRNMVTAANHLPTIADNDGGKNSVDEMSFKKARLSVPRINPAPQIPENARSPKPLSSTVSTRTMLMAPRLLHSATTRSNSIATKQKNGQTQSCFAVKSRTHNGKSSSATKVSPVKVAMATVGQHLGAQQA